MKTFNKYFVFALCSLFYATAWASNVTIPNNFTSGTPAVAADVNANFGAVETAVDENDGRITINASDMAALQSTVSTLQLTISSLQSDLENANNAINALQTTMTGKADVSHNHDASYSALGHNHAGTYSLISHDHAGVYAPLKHGHVLGEIKGLVPALNTHTSQIGTHTSQISAINSSEIMALSPYVTVANDSRGPIATFSGLNLQLVNGTGTTDGVPNRLGNFIIGYDVARNDNSYFCSSGNYTSLTSCGNAGYTWAVSHKTGSHYLIIGDQNNYSQYGGLVVGRRNTSNRDYASVSGGQFNIASGSYSSISGGSANKASGGVASISGGSGNIASFDFTSISGGLGNTASGVNASISGGGGNIASHNNSSILGGVGQTTSNPSQTIPALP